MKQTCNTPEAGERALLLEAAFNGDLQTLKKLIETVKQDVDCVDSDGYTPLHQAAMNGHLDCVTYLVGQNCNVTQTDIAGCTPLHHCAANGFIDVVKFLIDSNPDLYSQTSKKGYTAKHMALHRGHQKVTTYLEQYECSRNGGSWWM